MKILVIRGKSQYDSTCVFLDEIAETLQKNGADVDILDSYSTGSYMRLRRTLQQSKYDIILTINGMILEKDSTLGTLLLTDCRLYCTILMDHPYIHHTRLQAKVPNMLVYSPDFYHVNYLNTYYPNIKATGFLAHGGCHPKKVIPFSKRTIPISFLGSYTKPESAKNLFKTYPREMQALFTKVSDYLEKNPSRTVEQGISDIFSQCGITVSKEAFASVAAEFRPVDAYIRAYSRDLVIRTLITAKIPVDVYGDGWENFSEADTSFLHIHPRISFQDSLEITANSKISLNVMPWFKNGSHDRVFTSMLCGAVCLTDSSIYLEKEFSGTGSPVFYHLDDPENLAVLAQNLLENESLMIKIAEEGSAFAQKKHTWKHRGQELYEDFLFLLKH